MVEVRVEYDYDAENGDELTLRSGDIITNVVQKEGGWWEGKLNGKFGVFPDNFVKVIGKDQSKYSSDTKSNGIPLRTDKKRRCRVIYSYPPQNDDELELEVNAVIEVIEEVEEGWWRGVLNGRVGVFPSNFVEEIKDRTASARESRSSKEGSSSDSADKYSYRDNTDSGSKDIKPKPVRGVGLGNIFQDEHVRLKSAQETLSDKKAIPPKKPPPPAYAAVPNDAPLLPPKPVREQARVLFAYEGQNEDELTLKEGETINIISKEIEDKGWWKGELNNLVGVFPDNFVELIIVPEVKLKKPERTSLTNKPAPTLAHMHSDIGDKISDKPPSLTDYPRKISSDTLKRDDKPEKLEKPTPPLPGKKPQLPPPLKKPQRPSAPIPMAETLTDDMKVKSQSRPETHAAAIVDDSAFDSIETSSDKLTHLTATRVRNPHRRPPSHVFMKDSDNRHPNGEVVGLMRDTKGSEMHSNPLKVPELPNHEEEMIFDSEERMKPTDASEIEKPPPVPPVKKEVLAEKPPIYRPPLPRPATETDGQTLPAKPRPYTLPPKPSSLAKEELAPRRSPPQVEGRKSRLYSEETPVVTELRQEVTKLKNQVITLQQTVDSFKSTYSARMEELMQEIDEEKKTRLAMQVELERLKKLVREH